jgi:hypothetical protein
VFSLESPPNSLFSRYRYSQILLDAMLIFGLKLFFDFIQRFALNTYNDETILLSFITCPISPKYCDFDERVGSSDVIWDVDGRTIDEIRNQRSNKKTGEVEPEHQLPKIEALPSVALEEKIVTHVNEKDPDLNFPNLQGPGWD